MAKNRALYVNALAHGWLSRIALHGPTLVSLLLAALLVVELLRISLTFAGAQARAAEPDLQRPLLAVNRPASAAQTIIAAHLFGTVAPAATTALEPADAPISTANLVLAGTIVTDFPARGIAIIAADGPSKLYRVDDDVMGARLRWVHRDHVILERRGQLEKLVLRSLLKRPATLVRQAAPPQGPTVIRGAAIRPPLPDPRSLGAVMRAEVSLDDRSEKLRGFRIYSGSNRSAFNGSGLHAGDLVVAVNGTPLAQQDRLTGQRIFDSVQTAGTATLTIVRSGQTRDIVVDISP